MRNAERNFYTQNPQSWLSALRFAETCGKKRRSHINGNLYHYAGNNPVKYTDSDGRESGFVLDFQGGMHMGHSGIFVKTENGY